MCKLKESQLFIINVIANIIRLSQLRWFSRGLVISILIVVLSGCTEAVISHDAVE